jgi:hypothetical protein
MIMADCSAALRPVLLNFFSSKSRMRRRAHPRRPLYQPQVMQTEAVA